MHDISEEKLKELLIEKKLTDRQAAVCLGVGKETIRRRREAIGISPKPKRPAGYYSLTKEQNTLVEELYKNGFNDYEVASKMKLGRNRLRLWRREHEVPSHSNKKGFGKKDAETMNALVLEGHTLTDIGNKYGVRRSSISRCLKLNGCVYEEYRPKHPAWVESYKLTKKQEQVLLGDLLGDGALVSTSSKSAYMQFGHAIDQELFVRWKSSVMEPLTSNIASYIKHNSVIGKTWTSPALGYWYGIFYPKGVKTISKDIISKIEPLGLAVWFMGDGSISRNTVVIHVGLKVDVQSIVDALNKKFGNIFVAKKYEKEWHIRVSDPDTFCAMVCPHILDYFKYKIPDKYQHYIEDSEVFEYYLFTRSKDYIEMTPEIKEKVLDKLCSYYHDKGFPYPSYGYNKIRRDCLKIASIDFKDLDSCLKSNAGRKTCNHFMQHRYDARRHDSNPMSHWSDVVKYREFMKNRLTHAEGIVSDSVIRTGLSLKGLPTNFPPILAKYIYQKYNVHNGSVLDFSAGYGGRLLGWMSSGIGGTYCGVDPCTKSYQGLVSMSEYCSRFFNLSKYSITLYNKPFEDIDLRGMYDLVFSSPPYFGLEIYSDENTQSILRYPIYAEWLEKFWGVVVSKSYSCMKKGSYFVYSIGNYNSYDLVSDTQAVVLSKGFTRVEDNISISYHNVFSDHDKTETVYVFLK